MKNKPIRVLIVDNNDSFTFNLIDILRKFKDVSYEIVSHEKVYTNQLFQFDKCIISPGPGRPSEYDFMNTIINHCEINHKSLLGICLGHQAICEYYGAKLDKLSEVAHGEQRQIIANSSALIYRNLPEKMRVGLYHSWVVELNSLPSELMITSKTANNLLMSVQHIAYDIHGIQFHPESFLTPNGIKIIENFLYNDIKKV